jgi:hypothetical protein
LSAIHLPFRDLRLHYFFLREANTALRRGKRITCQQQEYCVGSLFITDKPSWQALNDNTNCFFPPEQSIRVARSEAPAPHIDACLRYFAETIFPFWFYLTVNTFFFITPDI